MHRLLPLPRLPGLILAALVAFSPAAGGAQVVVVDEGTFSLFVRGTRVGREDFSIRRAPASAAAAFVAQGNVILSGTRLEVALNTDSLGLPLRFELKTFALGRSTEQVTGEERRGLWSGRAVNAVGESAREFRLPTGSIAAEGGVVHHLWFLMRFGGSERTTELLPRLLSLREIRVEPDGREPISIGEREYDAQKWVVRALDGTLLQEVWTDTEGRLLRVRVPVDGLEAIRDDSPRETPRPDQAYDDAEPLLNRTRNR